MLDALISFFLSVIILCGLIYFFNAVFFSNPMRSRGSVIFVSGRAENIEQVIRAAVFADIILRGKVRTIIYDCGADCETHFIIQKLADSLGLQLLYTDCKWELHKT